MANAIAMPEEEFNESFILNDEMDDLSLNDDALFADLDTEIRLDGDISADEDDGDEDISDIPLVNEEDSVTAERIISAQGEATDTGAEMLDFDLDGEDAGAMELGDLSGADLDDRLVEKAEAAVEALLVEKAEGADLDDLLVEKAEGADLDDLLVEKAEGADLDDLLVEKAEAAVEDLDELFSDDDRAGDEKTLSVDQDGDDVLLTPDEINLEAEVGEPALGELEGDFVFENEVSEATVSDNIDDIDDLDAHIDALDSVLLEESQTEEDPSLQFSEEELLEMDAAEAPDDVLEIPSYADSEEALEQDFSAVEDVDMGNEAVLELNLDSLEPAYDDLDTGISTMGDPMELSSTAGLPYGAVTMQPPAPEVPPETGLSTDILLSVPHRVNVELGNVALKGKDILELDYGSVIPLDRTAGEPVRLVLEGKAIAEGEIVLINGKNLGVRIMSVKHK